MTTKDIRTAHVQVTCDVCGRTLLRGEHAETFLAGGSRRQVCELCTVRAMHEGWVREATALERGTAAPAAPRRRSFLGRFRRARGAGSARGRDVAALPAPPRGSRNGRGGAAAEEPEAAALGVEPAPRQVHAVPASVEQRTLAAIERFNRSEHTRTIAGVARSLGDPVVVVRAPDPQEPIVTIVVSWELCWYRYEVDLSDDAAAVRLTGQGYELSELPVEDRVEVNARVDELGLLDPV